MTLSVRLDRKTEAWLTRLARQRSLSKSEMVRESLIFLTRQEQQAAKKGRRPYDQMEHLIGCVEGGPDDLSTRTGKRFLKRLQEKVRARRSD